MIELQMIKFRCSIIRRVQQHHVVACAVWYVIESIISPLVFIEFDHVLDYNDLGMVPHSLIKFVSSSVQINES